MRICSDCDRPTDDYAVIVTLSGEEEACCRRCAEACCEHCDVCGRPFPDDWLLQCDECSLHLCHLCAWDDLCRIDGSGPYRETYGHVCDPVDEIARGIERGTIDWLATLETVAAQGVVWTYEHERCQHEQSRQT